ncbi:MAG TPA: AsmA family protein, partial [Cyclobacteriaceae bacterium]|nr:AsmA family protein [Cyclobacteriaceae bacterium]
MTPKKNKKISWVRILLRGITYLLALILVLMAVAYGIAAVNEKRILERLNEKLQTAINGNIQVGGLSFTLFEDFPTFSISLSNIYLRGPQYEKYHHDFFNAEKIYINIQPLQLITGTISLQSIKIKNANVYVFRASDGYTNMDTFKKKDKSDTVAKTGFKPTIDLKEISFENTQLMYFDSVKRKSYGLRFEKTDLTLESTDSSKKLSIAGGIFFNGMMLNESKGRYLKDKATQAKLDLEVVRGVPGFLLLPSVLQFEKST